MRRRPSSLAAAGRLRPSGLPVCSENTCMQLNGIAHIYLTLSDFDSCLPFQEKLLGLFEMHCLVKTDALYYCVGGRTGLGIGRATARHRDTGFDAYRSELTTVASKRGAARTRTGFTTSPQASLPRSPSRLARTTGPRRLLTPNGRGRNPPKPAFPRAAPARPSRARKPPGPVAPSRRLPCGDPGLDATRQHGAPPADPSQEEEPRRAKSNK